MVWLRLRRARILCSISRGSRPTFTRALKICIRSLGHGQFSQAAFIGSAYGRSNGAIRNGDRRRRDRRPGHGDGTGATRHDGRAVEAEGGWPHTKPAITAASSIRADYRPGSAKAQNCVEGRDAMHRFCAEQGIAHERCGKVVVATRPDELASWTSWSGAAGPTAWPACGGSDPGAARTGAARRRHRRAARARDRDRRLRRGLRGAGARGHGAWGADPNPLPRDRIKTSSGNGHPSMILEPPAARLKPPFSSIAPACNRTDRAAVRARPGLRIIPFRGEYYTIRPERRGLVRNLIYRSPTPRCRSWACTSRARSTAWSRRGRTRCWRSNAKATAGATCRRATSARCWPGPVLADGLEISSRGIGETHRSLSKGAFVRALQRLMPKSSRGPDAGGAGVRAQAVDRDGRLIDDFRIIQTENMIHVLNAPSPAATAAIAIGRKIAELFAGRCGSQQPASAS